VAAAGSGGKRSQTARRGDRNAAVGVTALGDGLAAA